jgi:tryptophanyl-tRNA synthetase
MQEVIFSGMRPTGRLQLGNLFGALENWVRLQNQGHRCFYCIVDWHALTTAYDEPTEIQENTREILIDWLSAGLDPAKSVIFRQSAVKEHAELHLLFSMFTPLSWLERCPTYKDQIQQIDRTDLRTYGFLGYPLLQTADILLYKGTAVPVGEDQAPHIELSREVARRFNFLYKPVFPEPKTLLNQYKLIPGLDGRKMSKSYGNTINLSADPAEIAEKVRMMVTDPQRIRKTDPGDPDVCTVHKFRHIFDEVERDSFAALCRQGTVGCVECKKNLAAKMAKSLTPLHEKRQQLQKDNGYLDDVLAAGAEKARAKAQETMEEVRTVMGL